MTILRLLNRPFSGQPKSDLQIDLQSSKGAKKQVMALAVLALLWVIFTSIAPIFILVQIKKLHHDDYENFDKALKTYLIGVCVVPVVAVLGVYLRWSFYRHWVVNRGLLVKSEAGGEIGMAAQDEGVIGVFMSEIVGVRHPEEISVAQNDRSLAITNTDTHDGSSTASYSRWSNGGPDSILTT